MACVYPYNDSAEALFRPAKGQGAADFFKGWSPADAQDDRLLCAEMSRLAYADEPVVTAALPRAGFAFTRWLGGGSSLAGRFASWGADGFVATASDGRIAIAFRGTESNRPEDLLVDLFARAKPWPSGGMVHEGFAAALAHVRPAVDAALRGAGTGPLLVTGHSLGAGLATVLAADLRARAPRLITFGSPRVGDANFAALIDPATVDRFANCCDMVARVPPEAFDQPHIAQLLTELTGNGTASGLAASALAPALSLGGLTTHVAHVGAERYIDASGTVSGAPTEATVKADQQQARTDYRATRPLVSVSSTTVTAALGGVVGAFTGTGGVAAAIRAAWAHLLPGVAGGTVPIRDLADHTPINYVSAVVRSFRAAGMTPC
jgi:hypothetical protein